ncbi:HAMP domain-containing sensor histidine kinase [Lentzea flava]|uniref:Signal transduction histidine-protein kinase/phosphatase MprB n=1 Tax=Lentzea flava TaxID=103732 RepID=A0ABQ2UUQ6_9PSEU|nr:HAMP domain-containing sensor histidine kinase [Lentzea flava]MCP2200704.1 Signal transduction histidine kinase [Lentzea flava]GGU54973.1 two-component sensor histidine kinase [Lentzea flava]
MNLAVRIALLCLGVAFVAVLVAGVVSSRLVLSTSQQVSREILRNQADVVSGQISNNRVEQVLEGQGIAIVRISPTGELSGPDRAAVRAAREAHAERVLNGSPVTGVSGRLNVEARPSGAGGFALVQETETGTTYRKLVRNIIFALAVGLVVACLAGLALGTFLARPLRRVASVAHSMSAGRRDLRVPVAGPHELAEVATSVNELADALQRSESRQRDFLLSVSHELRTPLTAVTGFAESLADGVVSGPQVAPVGTVILDEARRLDRLVTDLLDLARLGADDFRLDMAPVALEPVVRSAAEVWHARCHARGVTFALEVSATPVVHADARRLRQVIDGLLENALRVTPAGRPVVLALSSVLQVRDGGPGLAPEDYAVAFDRGVLHARYQESRPVGTGVGLALVHGLVTRMGGTISAGPAPEGGAAFTVTLSPAR